MSDSPEPKATKKSVSFPVGMLAYAERVAATEHGGNLSRYVQVLIEQDQKGSADIIVTLARRFAPILAEDLEQRLQQLATERTAQRALLGKPGVRQEMILFRLLEALSNALQRDFDPEAPFELYSSREQFLESLRASPAIFSALQTVAREAADVVTYDPKSETLHVAETKPMPPATPAAGIPNSPVNQVLEEERKRRAGRATGAGEHSTPGKTTGKHRPEGS